jgi:magnesium transporter
MWTATGPASLDETCEACRSQEGVACIGLYKPTAEEFESVAQEFELHPLAVGDTLDAHQRLKLERYGGTLFVVLKPARHLDDVERVEFGEIHIFLGRTSSSPFTPASRRTWARCARASRPTPSS